MSGIYIPNMKMPTEGEVSRLVIITCDGRAIVVDGAHRHIGEAIPVPDHGGRLIDAKWVRDAIIPKWVENADDSFMYKRGMEDAYEIIRNAPTIIPADKEK